jgi:hypothetical protein
MRAAWVGRFFLVDEQSLILRPLMAFADGTSSKTISSAAPRHSEHNIIGPERPISLTQTIISD